MTVHYPDDEEIAPSQLDYIRKFVNNFENRLFASNYTDADKGYRAYVDSTTLISWYLASEITANPDYIWSMYYYKQRDDDHLYFGPMWDYDIAFNNDNRLTAQDPTHNLMAKVAFTNNGLEKWIDRLWSDEWFQRAVYRSYASLYAQDLETKLLNKIDSLNTLLQQSQELNYKKWNIRTRYLREIVLYSTFDAYVNDLRNFISQRLPALLKAFANRCPDDVKETGIGNLQNKTTLEYALAYDPHSQRLHFGSDDLSALTFMVSVYDQAGHRMLQFPASQGCAVDHLPKGLYIVTWYDHGHHSTKFLK